MRRVISCRIAELACVAYTVTGLMFPFHVGATQIGHTGSLIYPVANTKDNTTVYKGVALAIENAPVWLHIDNASLLGPMDIYPGEVYKFCIDFTVGPEYNQGNAQVEMDVKIVVANPEMSFTWHESSDDGLQTSKATCVDNSGNLCSMEIVDPDITPPITTLEFFWDAITQPARTIINSLTKLEIGASDPDVKNSATSGVAFAGISIDHAPATFNKLQPFSNFFTLSEGPHTLYYASQDKAGNTEVINSKVIYVDGVAPASPINPKVDGANPSTSPWKNTKEFNISWTNPSDVAGIAGVKIKYRGAHPVSNGEGVLFVAPDASMAYPTPEIDNGRNTVH